MMKNVLAIQDHCCFFFLNMFSLYLHTTFGKLFADTKQKMKTYFSIHIHKKINYYYIILKDNYDGLLSNGRSLIHVIHLSLQVYIYTIQFILLKLDISEFLAR